MVIYQSAFADLFPHFLKTFVYCVMPCKDITDSLKILVDQNDNFVRYKLTKKTCGGDVGRRAMLTKWLKNKPISEILELTADELFENFPTKSSTWEYLYLKHFIAIKSGLSIIVGDNSGGIEDFCTVDSIEYTPEGITLLAELSAGGMNAEIAACAGCGTCGSNL